MRSTATERGLRLPEPHSGPYATSTSLLIAGKRRQPGGVRPRMARACNIRHAIRHEGDDALWSGCAAPRARHARGTGGTSELYSVVDTVSLRRPGGDGKS